MKKGRYFGSVSFLEEENIDNVWLTITDEDIKIELPGYYSSDQSWDIIHGSFTNLGKISLIFNYTNGGTWGAGGELTRITVSYIVKGHLLNNIDETFIQRISFKSRALNQWIFERKHGIESNHWKEFKIPDWLVIFDNKTNEFSVKLSIGFPIESSSQMLTSERNCEVLISFDKPKTLIETSSVLKHFKHWILFITHLPPDIQETSYNEGYSQEIFWNQQILKSNKLPRSIDLDYDDVKPYLGLSCKAWFEQKKLASIINLYLEQYYVPFLSSARNFLNLAVGIESFHTKFIEDKVSLHDSEPLINRNKIFEMIASEIELYKWFKSKSSFWKKPQLIDRLMDLKPLFKEVTKDVIDIPIDDFLTTIKQTRDELSHKGEYGNRFDIGIDSLLYEKSLRLILNLLLLKELGIPTEEKLSEHSLIEKGNQVLKNISDINNFRGLGKQK